eukprot:TCONS_00062392-protein
MVTFMLFLMIVKVGVFCRPAINKRNFTSAFDQIQWNNEHILNSEDSEDLFEDDIVKSPAIDEIINRKITSPGRQRRDVITGPYAWPNGKVPYVFADDYPEFSKFWVRSSMDEIQKVSCVQFIERTDEKDYIKIVNGTQCYSSIGRRGSNQTLSLGDNCLSDSIIQHELLHALGFFHEQSRLERDYFVTVHWDNIIKGKEHNFEKYGLGEASHLDEHYDTKSLMHYSNYIFAINESKMTISSKSNASESLGGFEMTDTDVRQLNKFYSCPCADHMFGCEFITSMCGQFRTQQYCQKSCGFCHTSENPPMSSTVSSLTTTMSNNTTTSYTTGKSLPTTKVIPTATTTIQTKTTITTIVSSTRAVITQTTSPETTTTISTPTTAVQSTATALPTTTSTTRGVGNNTCLDINPCCTDLATHGLCNKSEYIRSICNKSCNKECSGSNSTELLATTRSSFFGDEPPTPSKAITLFAPFSSSFLSLLVNVLWRFGYT